MKILPTLDRYVVGRFLRLFGLMIVGVPLMFMTTDAADQLDQFLARDVTPMNVLLHYFFATPQQALLGFPIAALLAAVFTVASLNRHSEIVATKAAGISFYRLSLPVLIAGLAVSGLSLVLTEFVPGTNRRATLALGEEFNNPRRFRTDFAYRAEEGRVYKIRRLEAESGEITNLQIEREGTVFPYPTYNIAADQAVWDTASDRWLIGQGRLRMLPDEGPTQTFRFQELHQRSFTETPSELLANPKGPEEMGYAELGQFIEAQRRSGGAVNKLLVQRMMKIAFPFACFVIVLFGMPLAYTSRKGGATLSIGIALATTMVFLVFNEIAVAVGAAGVVNPQLAAWLPNAAFLLAGLGLMSRVRT